MNVETVVLREVINVRTTGEDDSRVAKTSADAGSMTTEM